MKVAAAALALALAAPFAASADGPAPPKPESFKFTVTGGLSYLGRQEERIITVQKWTTPEDARSLVALRAGKGDDAVREELARWRAGTIRYGFGVVHAATSRVHADGRRSIRLLVSLPSFLGTLNVDAPRALPDRGIVELELDAKGKGLAGRVVQAPSIAF